MFVQQYTPLPYKEVFNRKGFTALVLPSGMVVKSRPKSLAAHVLFQGR